MPIIKTKTQKRDDAISLSKISTKHQVTIPQEVFEELRLKVGDIVEIVATQGTATLVPKRIVSRPPALKLTTQEQKLLQFAKKKIEAINKDILTSKGLTLDEADIAAKVDLIDPGQKYWWLEDWQKGERAAERDERAGRYTEYDSPEAFLKSLASR